MTYAEAEAYERQGQIKIHDPKVAFPGMAAAGKLAAECLDMLVAEAKEGVTTGRIDDLARQFVFDNGALPACVNYRGYRHTVCTSLNHVVCHGIPGDRVLKDGDIVNIDVTVIVDGWHGDTSRMYSIGPNVSRKAQRLMDVTYEAMMRGLAIIKPGVTLGDLGHTIQAFAEAERMSIVREFCGHGLGRVFHDAPNILHFGKPGTGDVLTGMITGFLSQGLKPVNAAALAAGDAGAGWRQPVIGADLRDQFIDIEAAEPAAIRRPAGRFELQIQLADLAERPLEWRFFVRLAHLRLLLSARLLFPELLAGPTAARTGLAGAGARAVALPFRRSRAFAIGNGLGARTHRVEIGEMRRFKFTPRPALRADLPLKGGGGRRGAALAFSARAVRQHLVIGGDAHFIEGGFVRAGERIGA